jgi:hypothetical protein
VNEPVSSTELPVVRVVAGRFLRSYLRFAYGTGTAGEVKAVTPAFRRQLTAERARATPVERGLRPRVLVIGTVATTPGFVVATATIEDGGVATYRLRFMLRERAGRWLVSSVQEG